LERSLQFIRPGGRMAIILPQGVLNNKNAEYIRRFIIDEARILAVVGLHENTFKPHTGTKTSVLFLRKYTEEEKQKIQEIKTKYEGEWENFIQKLREKYKSIDWNSEVNEEELPEELKSFIESYFETTEKLKDLEEAESEEVEENERKEETLTDLVKELESWQEILREKEAELANVIVKKKGKGKIKALFGEEKKIITPQEYRIMQREIRAINNKIRKSLDKIREKHWEGKSI